MAPFARLPVLPGNLKPITEWRNRDKAFDEVVTEIYRLVSGSEQKVILDGGVEELDKNPALPIQKAGFEEKEEERNKGLQWPHNTILRSSRKLWISIGVAVIILGTLLYILGNAFNSLSFLANIMIAVIAGAGLLIMFLQWAFPLPPAEQGSNNIGINRTQELSLRYLWRNPKVQIGIITLLVILVGGILFFAFQPRPNYSPIPNTSYTGVPVLKDSLTSLDSQSNSKDRSWINLTSNNGFCKFTVSGYHVAASGQFIQECFAQHRDFSDFAYQIEMTIQKGSRDAADRNGGGIIFRSDHLHSQYYSFYISQFGRGILYAISSDGSLRTIKDGSLTASVSDVTNQTFVIEVIARGEDIQVYVNNRLFVERSDGAYSHGEIGVFAQDPNGQTEVQFNSVEVWTL